MISTHQRRLTLTRMRRKRARIIHRFPHALLAIHDSAVIIDALERLVLLDLERMERNEIKETPDKK